MYKNILVPIDPSHQERHDIAFDMAQHLAADGAKITALTVVEHLPSYVGASAMMLELDDRIKKNVTDALAEFSSGRDVETAILHGPPGSEIVQYAKDKDIDCIVIASHKPGFGDFLLGSTAARVVRHAQCCVHVLR